MAFDPAGRLLAATSEDGTARVWDLTTTPARQKVWRLFRDGQWADGAAFTPDGRHLAVGCPDGTIAILRLANKGEVVRLPE